MKVYLVVDLNNAPGRVLAVFADYGDAVSFLVMSGLDESADIEERTLFYGQPPTTGYNR